MSRPTNVQVSLSVGDGDENPSIAGDATTNLDLVVTATGPSPESGQVIVRVSSNEGATVDISVAVQVITLVPHLIADTARLEAGVLRGQQTPSLLKSPTTAAWIQDRFTLDCLQSLPGLTPLHDKSRQCRRGRCPGRAPTVAPRDLPLGDYQDRW